jgi:hypothetical protein
VSQEVSWPALTLSRPQPERLALALHTATATATNPTSPLSPPYVANRANLFKIGIFNPDFYGFESRVYRIKVCVRMMMSYVYADDDIIFVSAVYLRHEGPRLYTSAVLM